MEEIYRFKNRVGYIKALDKILPDKFVQKRDIPTGKHKYIPSAIKEAIADDIFHYWNVTDEKYNIFVNELICTVKITFMPSYPGADELFCTGSASVPVQMDKGSTASSFPTGKKTNALEYNLPGVRSESIGNALGTLGNIFGRNLQRRLNKEQMLPPDFTIRKHEIAPDEKPKVEPDKLIEKIEPEKPDEKVKPKIELPF